MDQTTDQSALISSSELIVKQYIVQLFDCEFFLRCKWRLSLCIHESARARECVYVCVCVSVCVFVWVCVCLCVIVGVWVCARVGERMRERKNSFPIAAATLTAKTGVRFQPRKQTSISPQINLSFFLFTWHAFSSACQLFRISPEHKHHSNGTQSLKSFTRNWLSFAFCFLMSGSSTKVILPSLFFTETWFLYVCCFLFVFRKKKQALCANWNHQRFLFR